MYVHPQSTVNIDGVRAPRPTMGSPINACLRRLVDIVGFGGPKRDALSLHAQVDIESVSLSPLQLFTPRLAGQGPGGGDGRVRLN